MSFLNWPVEQTILSQRAQQARKRLALELLDRFGRTFAGINYQLLWESSTINSQAWRLGSELYVTVYGGLIRHPKITTAGLGLIVAHETGHHLGGLPFDPDLPWLTWQGQADYWAAAIGMNKVFGPRARVMTLRGARQIFELHKDFADHLEDDEPDLCPECRHLIFMAGLDNKGMPACAKNALAMIGGKFPN
jgi:hypothetical protein